MLHAWFAHRDRDLEGDDGNPMNEVRVIADSVVGNAGTPAGRRSRSAGSPSAPCSGSPSATRSRSPPNGFERLAAAYLAAIENTYLV